MKKKASKLFNPTGLLILLCLLALESARVTGAGLPLETALTGYLTRSDPLGLRFAPPFKPSFALLPPLSATYVPPPVFVAEYMTAVTEIGPSGALTQVPTVNRTASVASPTTATASQTRTSSLPTGSRPIQPQMLVRFFSNVKAGDVVSLSSEPITFQTPLRESTNQK